MRIKEGKEPLDATGIHPDHHKATYAFLEGELGIKKKSLKLPLEMPHYDESQISAFSTKYELGFETMEDIIKELQRPGLDPREEIEKPVFKSDVLDIKDVQIGMKLQGVVRNVTDFGAFVDVGLHNDGLVHKSQMADYFVQNPIDVVKVGQTVEVRVLDVDVEREKISLSMKSEGGSAPRKPRPEVKKDKKSDRSQHSAFNLGGNITFS